jgi:hypothetical protein
MKKAARPGWLLLGTSSRLCMVIALLAAGGLLPGCHRPGAVRNSPTGDSPLLDLKGATVDPFDGKSAKARVFVFVRTDCPISNRYAPEIERLYRQYHGQGISFWLVYPDVDAGAKQIGTHLKEYHLSLPALLDPNHTLVKKAKVRVTPEVAVFDHEGRQVYRGRIDNRFVDFGKERPAPTQRDLDGVLQSIVEKRAIQHSVTTAVGCYISRLP